MAFKNGRKYFASLKKFISILLLGIYVFGDTDAYQFLKLPQFIEHYRIHKTTNPDLTLNCFICSHYSSFWIFDNDFSEDMKLPFKTCEVAMVFKVLTVIPSIIKVDHPTLSLFQIKDTGFLDKYYPRDFKNIVFHPPNNKVA